MKRNILPLIALAIFSISFEVPLYASKKTTSASSKDSFLIDLRRGMIGTISVNDSLEQIKSKMGNDSVAPFTVESEGQTGQAHLIAFGNGEKIELYAPFASIKSKGFRTKNNLGVGSTWSSFKNEFQDGELTWASDANAIWSEKFKFRLYFQSKGTPKLMDQVTEIQMGHL